ncbi:Protein of unknown function [Cotesia congregata]|uniref:Uncharacterized protein n=1 Tax=Cotesia congregata TaxID=51543 RepID=A0A8J2HIH7_COTCN|nr:Protein of unknown function [Cotesia congregata]
MGRLAKYNLPYECILSEFKWMNSTTAIPQLPNSKEQLWKLLSRNDLNYVRHYYCVRCSSPLGSNEKATKNDSELHKKLKRSKTTDYKKCTSETCRGLDSKVSYFIQLKLYPQLHQLLSIPNISKSILYRHTRRKINENALEDIYDGCEYQKLCSSGEFLSNPNNMSFTLNTDGCSVSNSSKASAWPVYLEINELPPHARKRHMLLAGIYCDFDKPVMNNFLVKCMSELNDLYRKGIQWLKSDGTKVESKFVLLMCSVDSIARPPILRMTQFNGDFGCTYCYSRGSTSDNNQLVRYYPASEQIRLRTDKELRLGMLKAFKDNKKVNGVKECMHSVYLGVVRQHILLLLDLVDSKFFNHINGRTAAIKPPTRISRLPRPIGEIKNFKASEFRNWLLYYFLVCFDGLLESKYMKHFALLSQAIYYLNQASITLEELHNAEILLDQYVEQFEELFGIENMTFNVHLLKHLPQTIRNWGPMWAHNAFTFESWNHRIMECIISPKDRVLQVVNRFCIMKFICNMSHEDSVSFDTKLYLNSLFPSFHFDDNDRSFIAKGNSTDSVHSCIPPQYSTANCTSYDDARINNIHYRRIDKNPDTQFCNSYVYCKNVRFGCIEDIIELEKDGERINGLIVRKLKVKKNVLNTTYINFVESTSELIFVPSNEVVAPCIVIREIDDCKYIVKLPNTWESD